MPKMTKLDKIMQAAVNIEGSAVLLPERWNDALIGYTIKEGTRLAVGVYDYDKAVCRPDLIDLDTEDALLDDLRSVEGEVKPIIIHTRERGMNKNDKNYYRLKENIDWDGEKKYSRIIYRTLWMVAVNLLLKLLQPFTHDPFLVNVESEMDDDGNPHFIRYCFRRAHFDDRYFARIKSSFLSGRYIERVYK